MNKLKLAITGLVLVGGLFTATMFRSQPAAAASNKCTVEAVGTENSANKAHSKFTKDGLKVTGKFKVTGNNCAEPVTLASWETPNAEARPLSKQKLYKYSQKKFAAGVHTLTVEVPDCYFQVDMVRGMKPTDDNGGPSYGPERNMGWLLGGNRKCETPKPEATCVSLTAKKLTATQFQLNAKASVKDGAKIKSYTFTTTGNGMTETRTVKASSLSAAHVYRQDKPGTYTAKVTLETSEGTIKPKAACTAAMKVTPVVPGKIEVCEIATKKIVTISKDQMSSAYTTDFTKCEAAIVTPPTSPETPAIPEALPNTGAGSAIAIFTGVSSLSSAAYYVISRRFL